MRAERATGEVLAKDELLGILERLGLACLLEDELGRVNVLQVGV